MFRLANFDNNDSESSNKPIPSKIIPEKVELANKRNMWYEDYFKNYKPGGFKRDIFSNLRDTVKNFKNIYDSQKK